MAYKTFQNGYPLPASDLNNYLMNQSVIVFASAAARTADIPTPIEGMVTYLEDTDAVEVWDGSAWQNINDNTNSIPKNILSAAGSLIYAADVDTPAELAIAGNGSLLTSNGSEPAWLANSGTEGDVLQVSASGGLEWVEPAGGGGMTEITSGSLSGSSVSITSIPQTYKALRLEVTGASMDTNDSFGVRLNNDSSSNYSYPRIYNNNSVSSFLQTNRIYLFSQDLANYKGSVTLDVFQYKNTSGQVIPFSAITGFKNNSNVIQGNFVAGGYINSAAITSMQIVAGFGNFDAGTYKLWGVS